MQAKRHVQHARAVPCCSCMGSDMAPPGSTQLLQSAHHSSPAQPACRSHACRSQLEHDCCSPCQSRSLKLSFARSAGSASASSSSKLALSFYAVAGIVVAGVVVLVGAVLLVRLHRRRRRAAAQAAEGREAELAGQGAATALAAGEAEGQDGEDGTLAAEHEDWGDELVLPSSALLPAPIQDDWNSHHDEWGDIPDSQLLGSEHRDVEAHFLRT